MALSSSNAARQLSDGNSQGTLLGQSTTDKIGFFGVTTPVAQQAITGMISTGAVVSSIVAGLVALGLFNSTGAS